MKETNYQTISTNTHEHDTFRHTHTIAEISGKDLKLVKTINLTHKHKNTHPQNKTHKTTKQLPRESKGKKETINPNGSKTTNICLKHIVT